MLDRPTTAWLPETEWIRTELERLGTPAAGPVEEVRVQPWSTVLMVPTTAGRVFFKATAQESAHEPMVTRALAEWRPDCIPELLTYDETRRWMLLPDCGPVLRTFIGETGGISHWHRILPLYAGLQIDTAQHLPDLIARGLPDRRLAALPREYERLLGQGDLLRIGQPEGLTPEQLRALAVLQPSVEAGCAELAAYGLPETLQHDDLHDGNVFVRDGRYLIGDWGDCCAAHPFFTLVVTLRVIAYRTGLPADSPELQSLQETYLESWTGFAPAAELRNALALALRLGMLSRTLSWARVVSRLEGPEREEHADAVPYWLQEFGEAMGAW